MKTPEYLPLLKQEFERRCARNPRYSLRAFAKTLGLSPSALSDVLHGKHGLSRSRAASIARRLGYSAAETERFCDLVEARHARSALQKKAARARIRDYKNVLKTSQVSLDHFAVIADWHHFAILELALLEGFVSDPVWIARELDIAPAAAIEAIERLKRVGLLRSKGKKFVPSDEFNLTSSDVPSEAIRRFHQQILEKALTALALQPVERREFNSSLVSLRSDRLPEAKKALRDFHEKFCQEIATGPAKNRVYCLSTQLFEITQSPQEKEK